MSLLSDLDLDDLDLDKPPTDGEPSADAAELAGVTDGEIEKSAELLGPCLSGGFIDVPRGAEASPDPGSRKFNELVNSVRRPPQGKPGDPIYLDIETVPDESRIDLFPLPPCPPVTPLLMLKPVAEFNALTLEKQAEYLAGVTPDGEWFDLAMAAEKSREKGPRAGAIKSLNDKRNEADGRIKTMSLNPLMLRIVSIGYQVGQDGMSPVLFAENDDDERTMLEKVFAVIEAHRPVIGFNILDFDMRAMIIRATLLGVDLPRVFSLSKYSSPDVLDLQNVLFGGPRSGCGMKAVAKMMGIEVPDDHGDGSQVYGLWKKRDWASIEKYQRGDVRIIAEMHAMLAGRMCV